MTVTRRELAIGSASLLGAAWLRMRFARQAAATPTCW